MRLEERAAAVESRQDFVLFVQELSRSAHGGSEAWENNHFPSYFDAMSAWVRDMDGFFVNRGETVPEQPTWRLFAQILLAATVYE